VFGILEDIQTSLVKSMQYTVQTVQYSQNSVLTTETIEYWSVDSWWNCWCYFYLL